MMKTRFIFALSLLLGMVVSSGTANAQAEEAYEQLKKANNLASAGSMSRAIPHYEKAIELAPGQMPQAYFNLAEVHRAKGDCKKAVLPYLAYEAYVGTSEAEKEVARALKSCKASDWKMLTLKMKPAGARARIAGYLWPEMPVVAIRVPSDTYAIEVEAVDHHPQKFEVDLQEDLIRSVELEEMKFNGKVKVNAPEGSKIRIFAGPSDKTEVVTDKAKPGEEIEVLEGRHFVEVTSDGFDRWIRNVSVRRDETTEVKVVLTPSTPDEIR